MHDSLGEPISPEQVAGFVLARPAASIQVLFGIGPEALRRALDGAEARPDGPLALFLPLAAGGTAERIVENAAEALAAVALRLWPVWFGEASFLGCRNDTLGREAARAIIRRAAEATPRVSRPWAEAAALLALGGSRPRVAGTPPGIEIAQLCLSICRTGVVLVVDLAAADNNSPALVHAAEWMAHHAGAAVVLLLDAVPVHSTPLDRILHGARRIMPDGAPAPPALAEEGAGEEPWLGPVRGKPHPLSETEQRLASLIARDVELAPLFAFNQLVDTVRGTRPKVDLVWAGGRLVVELDGFSDHGGRAAFMHDRHRDYELSLSGYSVLRIANDEVSQDIEKAVDKIRDMVRFCRMRQSRGS